MFKSARYNALDFDLSVAEFIGTEWVEEFEDCFTLTAARMLGQAAGERQRGLIPHSEPTADHPREIGEYVLPEAALRQPQGLTPPQTVVFTSVLESPPPVAPPSAGATAARSSLTGANCSRLTWLRKMGPTHEQLRTLGLEQSLSLALRPACRLSVRNLPGRTPRWTQRVWTYMSCLSLPLIRCLGDCPPPLMSQAETKHQSAEARGCNSPSPRKSQAQTAGHGGLTGGIGGRQMPLLLPHHLLVPTLL